MNPNRPIAKLLGAVFSVFSLTVLIAATILVLADDVVPDYWNPFLPLVVTDPLTPVTKWKLNAALADDEQCLAALSTGAVFERLPDFEQSQQCHIRPQVSARFVAGASVVPLNTRCQTALRLSMWVEHGVKPAADRFLGQKVSGVRHLSSYNCRRMRTGTGTSTRMSTHATADAVDIAGFTLASSERVTLLQDWNSVDPNRRAFLRETHRSACKWFGTALGPDFNRLHADHFHLQNRGWGTCR